ncbi:type IV pilus assembly protein PilM [Oceanospirillum multiglobuliferum]|nr:pilus assembly protein PilM [Oceanospirillum multiglobuliferum]SKA22568.1 type IV pilus assembly protein PilM [Oceanospirillum multiglobuliferum]
MFDFFRGKKQNMLGLDISSSSVKLLELSSRNGRLEIESYGVAALPALAVVERKIQDPEQVGEAIKLVVERAKPSTRHTVAAVSGASVISRKIQLSASLQPQELESQILIEADQFIPFPLNEVSLDFEVLGPAKGRPNKNEILLVACRLETVDQLQDALKHGGLIPKVVDVENYAIERAVSLLKPQFKVTSNDPLIAVVDIGATMTNLSILHQGEIIYSRDQVFGGKQLTDEIMRRFNLSFADAGFAKKKGGLPPEYQHEVLIPFQQAAVQQINRSLQLFYSSSAFNNIDYILLAGGSSATLGLASVVKEYLGVPCSVANPFLLTNINPRISKEALNNDAPALLVAFGLAMRNLDNASD